MGYQVNPRSGLSADRIPVIKLPAEKLDPSLVALITTMSGFRREVEDNVLLHVYPSKWNTRQERSALVKRFMRALVAPTLTRLHFARSDPPYFRPAPNGLTLRDASEAFRMSYTSLCVFDFATLRLGLDNDVLPPDGSLRRAVASHGAVMVDRVRGLDAILRFYLEYHPERGNTRATSSYKVGHVEDYNNRAETMYDVSESALPQGRIIQVDAARELIMRRMLSKGILVSSFVVDEWLRLSIRSLKLSSFKAPFAAIDSLMDDTKAIGGVMLPTRGE